MNPAIVGILAGVLTSISLLPQLIRIIRKKEAKDLSYWMLIVLLFGLGGWIYYGVLKEDLPIIITNSFSFFINTLVIFFTIRYRNNDASGSTS